LVWLVPLGGETLLISLSKLLIASAKTPRKEVRLKSAGLAVSEEGGVILFFLGENAKKKPAAPTAAIIRRTIVRRRYFFTDCRIKLLKFHINATKH